MGAMWSPTWGALSNGAGMNNIRRLCILFAACLALGQLPHLVRYVAAVSGVARDAAALQVAVDSRAARMQRAMDEAK